jgi:truncated hemoglobin YjbI
MSSQVPTIYEWAGGQPAFERWLGRFYDLVENDVLLAPLFGTKGQAAAPPKRGQVVVRGHGWSRFLHQ